MRHCLLRLAMIRGVPPLRALLLARVLLSACVLLLGAVCPLAQAQEAAPHKPQIAIIMDDMGERWVYDQRIVALDGPVTCAFFSFGIHTPALARLAHARNKEVILHLPMQAMPTAPTAPSVVPSEALANAVYSIEIEPVEVFGPNELYLDLTEAELKRRVAAQLAQVPFVSGVNNHQGSLLTRHPGAMQWLMQALRADSRPLFFVDSLTASESVALQIAGEEGVPSIQRHVFLDHDPAPEKIAAAFARLVRRAKSRGYAVAIGHPYSTTVAFLEKTLPSLSQWGVELVPVSTLVQREQQARSEEKQAR